MERGLLNSPTDANSISMANAGATGTNTRGNMPSYPYTGNAGNMPGKPCGCGGPKAIQPPPMSNWQPAPQNTMPIPQNAYPQPGNTPRPYTPMPKQ